MKYEAPLHKAELLSAPNNWIFKKKIFLVNSLGISHNAFRSYSSPLPQLLLDSPSPFYSNFEFSFSSFFFFLKQTNHQVQFVVANYSWEWGYAGMWMTNNDNTLKKTNSLPPGTYQMPTTPQLVLGFGLAWACMGLVYSVTITVSLYVQLPYCIQKTLFPWSHLPCLALAIFPPSSKKILRFCRDLSSVIHAPSLVSSLSQFLISMLAS